MRCSLRLHLLVLSTLLLLVSAKTHADVDIQVNTPAKVVGNLKPEGEIETIRFDAAARSKLSFTVLDKKERLDLTVVLVGPDDVPIDLKQVAKRKAKGSKILVEGLRLAQSGSHRLEVSAVGTGKYTLQLELVARGKWADTLSVGAGAALPFSFAAPAGSQLSLKAVAPKGSAAEPRFGDFEGQDLSALGTFDATSHRVSLGAPMGGGDLIAFVSNLAPVDGAIKVQARVEVEPRSVQKSDVRGKKLGRPDGDETILVRPIGAVDGGSVGITDAESDIIGAAVDVPAGALADDTLVQVSSAKEVPIPDPASRQGAGPSVAFGPDGTVFAAPVAVTLPYSPEALPFGADPMSDLEVLRLDSEGNASILSPTAVDLVEETVTVETNSFSRFAAITDRGSPQLDGREYWFFTLETEHKPALSGLSWSRLVLQASGEAAFGDSGAGTFSFTGLEKETHLDHAPDGAGSTATTSMPFEGGGDSGTWSYLGDGQSVALSTGPADDDDLYFVSESGRFLLRMAQTSTTDPVNILELLIEKPSTQPTPASLAGSYYWGDVFFEPADQGAAPLVLSTGGAFGTLTLEKDGRFQVKANGGGLDFRGDLEPFGESDSDQGRFRIEPDGSLVLDFGGGESDTFYPSADGRVLFGPDGEDPAAPGGNFAIFTRQGSELSASLLSGEYAMVGLEFELETASLGGAPVGDFASFNVESRVVFDANGGANFSGTSERAIFRDGLAPGGIRIDTDSEPNQSAPYSINAKGKVKLSSFDGEDEETGAALPDGGLLFWRHAGDPSEVPMGLFLSIKLPPAQP